ncbi:hypothetical protein DY000_02015597 [Brassica cretica]|uniref:Uncharacterized protein n=1 Tax=Brassica cretica TaxID=69181 RepID=A0ABQ7CVQ6_BRACR|nr:hypothetical protein DY000_02015597 [Brassica cretica]
MKFVVPCIVFEGDFPIPPDKSVHLGSYNGVFDDHMYAVASQRGLRFRGDFGKGPTEAVPNDINKPASIDTTSSSSSIDSHRVSEQIEFKVYQKLFDGGTTTRSDKSGGKMRKNWKKSKRTNGSPQLSLIHYFSDGIRKTKVRSKCFSQPFAKLRALLITEMIDKGEKHSTITTLYSTSASEMVLRINRTYSRSSDPFLSLILMKSQIANSFPSSRCATSTFV